MTALSDQTNGPLKESYKVDLCNIIIVKKFEDKISTTDNSQINHPQDSKRQLYLSKGE